MRGHWGHSIVLLQCRHRPSTPLYVLLSVYVCPSVCVHFLRKSLLILYTKPEAQTERRAVCLHVVIDVRCCCPVQLHTPSRPHPVDSALSARALMVSSYGCPVSFTSARASSLTRRVYLREDGQLRTERCTQTNARTKNGWGEQCHPASAANCYIFPVFVEIFSRRYR